MEQYSAVVARLRPEFLEWLQAQPGVPSRPYRPEEDMVWLIPKTSSFIGGEALERYLDDLSEMLLRAELERFGPGAFEAAVAEKTLAEVLELEVRDDVRIAPRSE